MQNFHFLCFLFFRLNKKHIYIRDKKQLPKITLAHKCKILLIVLLLLENVCFQTKATVIYKEIIFSLNVDECHAKTRALRNRHSVIDVD